MAKTYKKAIEIVSDVKKARETLGAWGISYDLDFLGCSSEYVLEKITLLQNDLALMKKIVKDIDKTQRGKK